MYSYLNQHPDIFMSPVKEIHHFGQDCAALLKIPGDYLSFFSQWKDQMYAGEASVFYLYSQTASLELKEFNPAARIIIMLRNPVDFLHSYHRRILTVTYEDIADFEAALEAEPDRRRGERLPRLTRKHGAAPLLYYRSVAAFSEQVQRYFDAFGRDQVKVILLDDMKADVAAVYRDTMIFLGVDPDFQPEFPRVNANRQPRSMLVMRFLINTLKYTGSRSLPSRAYKKLIFQPLRRWNMKIEKRVPMPLPLRKKLQAEFEPEVEKLGKLLGRDLSHWNNIPRD